MKTEMLLVFAAMSIALPALLGLIFFTLRQTVMYIGIFLGMTFGIAIGLEISSNELVWFFICVPLTTGLIFLIVWLFDRNYFRSLKRNSIKR